MRRFSLSITEWTGDLASRFDWVVSPSYEPTKWPDRTFCPVVLQLAWRFSFSAYFTHVHPLVACQSWATCEIQSRVPALVHSFEHLFTLSQTLFLHVSHLNTGFLSAELQANWHGIKPIKWLIKFNLTIWNIATISRKCKILSCLSFYLCSAVWV